RQARHLPLEVGGLEVWRRRRQLSDLRIEGHGRERAAGARLIVGRRPGQREEGLDDQDPEEYRNEGVADEAACWSRDHRLHASGSSAMLPRLMLRGLVATMRVADLLEWMERRAVSGTVIFDNGARGSLSRRLTIEDGAVVRVTSSHPAEHLGRILVGA